MAVRSGRAGTKQPRDRETQKPKQKTFQDECKERIVQMHDARREKLEALKREQYRVQEDEVMAATYGPNWRTRYLAHDPLPTHHSETRIKVDIDDDDEPDLKAG